MRQQQAKRSQWFTVRLSAEEYAQLESLSREAVCPSLSDYGRKVLLFKPVNIRYRNQSLDDFLADMVELRADLSRLGNNFNQAVHRLHALQRAPEIHQWLAQNEQDKMRIFRLVESISKAINDAYSLWSRV